MLFAGLSLTILGLAGCQTGLGRIDRSAQAAGLTRSIVQGQQYRHVVYANRAARLLAEGHGDRLMVFLDGDGRPWTPDGQQPSVDPTTQNPLALKLLARTRAASIYISRPCYQQLNDPTCSPEAWTSGRYSSAVVESIVAAIGNAVRAPKQPEIVLVGYSGGGALAVLAAERIANMAAVITIAADLDIDAWTKHHGYLPLSTSLNPAASNTTHPWLEIHLQGARDTVVPSATTEAYFTRHAQAQRWPFDQYDHVCCWVESWPESLARIEATLQGSKPARSPPKTSSGTPASHPASRR